MLPTISPYDRYLASCRRGHRLGVLLGSPRLGGCRGQGICDMVLDDELHRHNCPRFARAYARVDPLTGRLLLHFVNASIDAETELIHFHDGSFTVEHAYALPRRIARSLDLPPGEYRIASGNYPLLEDEEFTTLSLRIVQPKVLRLPRAKVAA